MYLIFLKDNSSGQGANIPLIDASTTTEHKDWPASFPDEEAAIAWLNEHKKAGYMYFIVKSFVE